MTLPTPLQQALTHKRLIFSVTTGRSGTAYLTTLFSYISGVDAFHEPEPQYYRVLRDVQQNRELATSFLLQEKLPAVAGRGAMVYVETSHLFCKGFLEPLLELGITPDLIFHSRPPRSVAGSMYRLGTIPGRTAKGLQFYLSPDDPGVLRINDWQGLHDYQLCYWYCLEMERRAAAYEDLYARLGGVSVKTTLDGVRTTRGFLRMVDGLGLKRPNLFQRLRHMRNSRFKVNEAHFNKKPVQMPEDLHGLEAEVRDRCLADRQSAGLNPATF